MEHLNETIRNRELQNRIQGTPRRLPAPPVTPKQRQYGPIAARFLQESLNKNNDNTFGIYSEQGKLMMGDKGVRVQGDDILIGDEMYLGTPGV